MVKLEFLVDQSCNKIFLDGKEFPILEPYSVHVYSAKENTAVWLELIPEGNNYSFDDVKKWVNDWKKKFPHKKTHIFADAQVKPPLFGGRMGVYNNYITFILPSDKYSVKIVRH